MFAIVVGTIECTIVEQIDVLEEQLLSVPDISEDEIVSGTNALKAKFPEKMKSVGNKIEVSCHANY